VIGSSLQSPGLLIFSVASRCTMFTPPPTTILLPVLTRSSVLVSLPPSTAPTSFSLRRGPVLSAHAILSHDPPFRILVSNSRTSSIYSASLHPGEGSPFTLTLACPFLHIPAHSALDCQENCGHSSHTPSECATYCGHSSSDFPSPPPTLVLSPGSGPCFFTGSNGIVLFFPDGSNGRSVTINACSYFSLL